MITNLVAAITFTLVTNVTQIDNAQHPHTFSDGSFGSWTQGTEIPATSGSIIEEVSSNVVSCVVWEGKTNETLLSSAVILRRSTDWKKIESRAWATNEWAAVERGQFKIRVMDGWMVTNLYIISK